MSTQIDPYKNFKFRIVLDSTAIASFQELQGITTKVDVVEHRSPMELLHVSGVQPVHWRTLVGVRDRAALDRAARQGRPGALLLKGFEPLPGHERMLQHVTIRAYDMIHRLSRQPGATQGYEWLVHLDRWPVGVPTLPGSILLNEPVKATVQQWKLTNAMPMKVISPSIRIDGADRLPPDQVLLLFEKIQPARQGVYDFPGAYAQRFDGVNIPPT